MFGFDVRHESASLLRRTWTLLLIPLVSLAGLVSVASNTGAQETGGNSRDPVSARIGIPELPDSLRSEFADSVYVFPQVETEDDRDLRELAPGRVTVRRSQDDLQRYAPLSWVDGLASVPGVDVTKTGPWASRPVIRGLSGDRVLVLVDDVRLNTVRGHGAQPSIVSSDVIEEVAVDMGSNSARYGSSALGGVLRVKTHRPLFSGQRTLDVGARGRWSVPGDGWAQSSTVRLRDDYYGLEVTGGFSGLDALHVSSGAVGNSGYSDQHLSVRGGWLWERLRGDLQYTRGIASDVGLPAFTSSGGGNGSYPWNTRTATRLELVLEGQGRGPHLQALIARQSYRTRFEETTVDSVFRNNRLIATRSNFSTSDQNTRSTEYKLGALSQGGGMQFELSFLAEETDGPEEILITTKNRAGVVTGEEDRPSENVPPAERNTFFARLSGFREAGAFAFEAHVRQDIVETMSDSTDLSEFRAVDLQSQETSLGFGAAWDAGHGLEPFLGLNTGFRVPNLDERFFDGFIHGLLRVFGNPELEDERSDSAEIGLRYRNPGPGMLQSARVSVYRSWVEDMITLHYLGQIFLIPRFQYRNVEEARLEGYEFEAAFESQWARLLVSAGFPRGYDTATDERLPDVGTNRATAEVTFNLDRLRRSTRLAVQYRWNDAVDFGDEVFHRPSFSTTSLSLRSRFGPARAAIALRNLFDEDYREPLSFIDESGLTWTFSLSWQLSSPLGDTED